MNRDGEAQMIAFYVLRGHTLDEMTGLSVIDRLFYMAAMEKHIEEVNQSGE